MQKFTDYYRILQVHYLADPEVIESAYKRLAKKYHPDINRDRNAQGIMQNINQAYEVLRDTVKRRRYDLVWKEKSFISNNNYESTYEKNEKLYAKAKSVLDEYFRNIINNRFEVSYELISGSDKLNVSKEDFIIWQHMVSEVFKLKEYSCKVEKIYKNETLERCRYKEVVEFSIDTVEYNIIMDLAEKNTVKKKVVSEDDKWYVFLGYKDLQPIIEKLKSLTGLLTAKSVIRELVESHSKIDCLTGLLNKNGVIERLESEISRYNRYGNVFSLIICDVEVDKALRKNAEQKERDMVVKHIGGLLVENLRKLDVIGRLKERTFLIILPETNLSAARKVVSKLNRLMSYKELNYENKIHKFVVEFKTTEYSHLNKNTLNELNISTNI